MFTMAKHSCLAGRILLYASILGLVNVQLTTAFHIVNLRALRAMSKPPPRCTADRAHLLQARNILGGIKAEGDLLQGALLGLHTRDIEKKQENDDVMKPCCFPSFLHATGRVYGSDYTVDTVTTWNSEEQSAAVQVVRTWNNGEVSRFNNVVRYDQQRGSLVLYDYADQSEMKMCTVHKITGPFEDVVGNCIPENAIYNGVVNIGLQEGGKSLHLHSWKWVDHYQRDRERIVTSHCLPVVDIAIMRNITGHPYIGSIYSYYSQLSTTKSDHISVFDIPSNCQYFGAPDQAADGDQPTDVDQPTDEDEAAGDGDQVANIDDGNGGREMGAHRRRRNFSNLSWLQDIYVH